MPEENITGPTIYGESLKAKKEKSKDEKNWAVLNGYLRIIFL